MNALVRSDRERKAKYMRDLRKDNPEYRNHEREYHKEWRKLNPDKMKKYRKKYRVSRAQYQSEYRKRNPEKIKAQHRAKYLPLDEECQKCGSDENLQHHHPDYSKPELTLTVCFRCHQEIHRGG